MEVPGDNLNGVRIREARGAGKLGPVVKDDGAEAESWTQGADFFGYVAGAEQKDCWRRGDGLDHIGVAFEFDEA